MTGHLFFVLNYHQKVIEFEEIFMNEREKYFNLLTTELSFWSGMASTLDIGNNLYTYTNSPTPEEADRKALAQDWYVVGQDFYEVLANYEQAQ